METVKTIAQKLGKHPRTISRRIKTLNGHLIQVNGGKPFSDSLSDPLPDAVAEYLLSKIVEPGAAMPAQEPKTPLPVVREKRRVEPVVKVSVPADDIVFKNKALLITFAVILISVDALSFGWIAWNTYPSFHEAAAVIFACAGMATGYSAFKNIISYKGWSGDAWAWGFGLFQFALHLCAMEVIGDWSFIAGKIVVAMGLPLATAGLATALKMDK